MKAMNSLLACYMFDSRTFTTTFTGGFEELSRNSDDEGTGAPWKNLFGPSVFIDSMYCGKYFKD